jgi:alkylhydroperoxidase/carboxymuconolactone decarboxylase family protein YurZ
MARKLDARRKKLKAEFTKARGYWNALWNDILDLSPEFFEAYMQFSSVPWKSGPLAPKVKEFIYIAIDASTTHLHDQGLRVHIGNALRYGATKEEIMEVMQLTSVLGIHTITMGMPILYHQMEKAGRGAEIALKPLDKRRQALKDRFTKNRGYWSSLWDGVLQNSPDFFEAYMGLSSVPWLHGVLEPKVREFIYIAIDAATTHLYEPGTHVHIENALRHGATMDEIVEVFQLTAVLGIHTYTLGIPALLDEMKKAKIPVHGPVKKPATKKTQKKAKKKLAKKSVKKNPALVNS